MYIYWNEKNEEKEIYEVILVREITKTKKKGWF